MASYRVEPLTSDRIDDFATVLGPGGVSGCWCMYWLNETTKEWSAAAAGGGAANREAFGEIVRHGPPPGLISYDGDAPVAWCRVMPREQLPGLDRSRWFTTDLDVTGVWSLSCFVVRSSHRRRGLTSVLTEAAVDYAAAQGARFLEVYPRDVGEGGVSSSALWTGVASTFRKLGFTEVQRRAPTRPMLRLAL